MKDFLNSCRTITLDTQANIEKNFFDENFGFRHIPGLFQNAFKSWFTSSRNDLITIQKPSYLECWYEKHATENAPQMKDIIVDKEASFFDFKKNIWDLSSWHFLAEGEITWLFYPPAVIEYLQLHQLLPEASAEKGLHIDCVEIAAKYNVKPLKVIQRKGELLFIPPMFAYALEASQDANLFSKTILTEYNHDNLYAYFRKTTHKASIKQIILDGFTNTKHLSIYETPMQRLSKQIAA
jgi:hypothetical protein